MLSLAQNAMSNILNKLDVDSLIVANAPLNATFEVSGDREVIINKLETLFNGFESNNGAYVIMENGILIQYLTSGVFEIKLSGDSMRGFTDVFVKSLLVAHTSFESKGSTAKEAIYKIDGDIVGFIDNLKTQYNVEVIEKSGEIVYHFDLHSFKLVIVESFENDDTLELKLVY